MGAKVTTPAPAAAVKTEVAAQAATSTAYTSTTMATVNSVAVSSQKM